MVDLLIKGLCYQTKEQVYEDVIKTKRDRKYKDYGPRIKSVKLSRKTLQ